MSFAAAALSIRFIFAWLPNIHCPGGLSPFVSPKFFAHARAQARIFAGTRHPGAPSPRPTLSATTPKPIAIAAPLATPWLIWSSQNLWVMDRWQKKVEFALGVHVFHSWRCWICLCYKFHWQQPELSYNHGTWRWAKHSIQTWQWWGFLYLLSRAVLAAMGDKISNNVPHEYIAESIWWRVGQWTTLYSIRYCVRRNWFGVEYLCC